MADVLEESEQVDNSPGTDLDATKMKVIDLKRELKTRGLSTTGIKSELVERLQESLSSESSATELNADTAADELSTDDLIDESVLTEKIPSPAPPEPIESTKPKIVLNRELTSMVNFEVDKENETKKAEKPISEMTQMERLEFRAKRFGVAPSAEALRLARTEKFAFRKSSGDSKPVSAPATDVAAHVEKMKKRAERFGLVTSSKLAKVEEVEKLQKRKQRFSGGGAEITVSKVENNSDALKRPNLSASDQEDLKLKRAKRFGLTT